MSSVSAVCARGLLLLLVCAVLVPPPAAAADPFADLELVGVLAVDDVARIAGLPAAADLLSVTLYRDAAGQHLLRVSFLSLSTEAPGRVMPAVKAPLGEISLSLRIDAPDRTTAIRIDDASLRADDGFYRVDPAKATGLRHRVGDVDALWLPIDATLVDGASPATPLTVSLETTAGVESLTATFPAAKAYEAHCAFVLHGNQGLGYSDVFYGDSGNLEGSGFDEAMQVHEATNVPGNFHLSGTLQSSAEWAAQNGDPLDFNNWLADGVTAGWAGMVTSAYAQHIMPFVNDDMNDWSVSIESDMIDTRYGYTPRVAWVPERVWLNPTGYPSAGVNDWIGDNFEAHGVWGVILDDDVHLAGHDNHQIHTLSGTTLRLIPRDRDFTGNIIGGNGQASLDILTGLAGGSVGEYRIAVFAEDWEAPAEMGIWATVTPNAMDTYDWFINKCATESSWLHTWKLADAITNPNFAGDTFTPAPGTYGEIGGGDGYGGGDNGWYTHWAGWIPFANGGDGSGNCAGDPWGNCKNYGTLWNDAYTALMAAPDNNISQAGWYVMMTNLHETGWHDGMGGDISGWQHKYSAHIKNAMIYAEAAHWANGDYATTTNCYEIDIDNDGYIEVIMHNDHVFAVFRGVGGRLTNLFVKGSGYEDTAIGIDNAYWADTNADYNDVNHIGAFSDVSPNYQHTNYGMSPSIDGTTASLTMTCNEVTKTVTLEEGDSFFDVVYSVGPATHWMQSGFSPSLVDLVWNAQLDRIWPSDGAYMGHRNPNTGIGAAWVIGDGGAAHQKDFTSTLMKGDELMGSGVFQFALYAGPTSVPDGTGDVAELRAVANNVTDTIGPAPTAAWYYPATDRLRVAFDQPVASLNSNLFAVSDTLGSIMVPIQSGADVAETLPSPTITLDVDPAVAAAIESMTDEDQILVLWAGAVTDENANGNLAVGAVDRLLVEVVDTAIVIDGQLTTEEWNYLSLPDSNDSVWTSANEIDRLGARWDETYLYLAIDGVVEGNSWILYLDVDPGTANGETDLTATDAWERGATFSATDFAADFEYGCYQHQSTYDGDGFWELTSATTTVDRSGEISSAFDSYHDFGDASGSEMAIPWDVLYGLGAGVVPAGAQISIVASICWDSEPDGELGGDSAPSNSSAALPEVDTVWTITIDGDADGLPDPLRPAAVDDAPAAMMLLRAPVPNPFNPMTTISFDLPGPETAPVSVKIFDVRGRQITTLVDQALEPGHHSAVWRGRDDTGRAVAAGTYFCRLQYRGQVQTRSLSLVK